MKPIRNRLLVNWQLKRLTALHNACLRHVLEMDSGDARRFILLALCAVGQLDTCELWN